MARWNGYYLDNSCNANSPWHVRTIYDVVSRHRTEELAEKARLQLQDDAIAQRAKQAPELEPAEVEYFREVVREHALLRLTDVQARCLLAEIAAGRQSRVLIDAVRGRRLRSIRRLHLLVNWLAELLAKRPWPSYTAGRSEIEEFNILYAEGARRLDFVYAPHLEN